MLGLRTNPKQDLNTSPAEMVYGAPLTVPGDFVPDGPQVPVQDHLRQLREKVENLRPVPTIAHGTAKTNVPDRLLKAKFVFIRTDARKTPLQTPFTGPYAVIDRNDKFFTLQMGNKQDTVSIDRLKEAIVQDDGLPVPVAQPPRRGANLNTGPKIALCKNFGPTKGVVSIFIKGQLSERNVKKLFETSELISILDPK